MELGDPKGGGIMISCKSTADEVLEEFLELDFIGRLLLGQIIYPRSCDPFLRDLIRSPWLIA